MTFRRGRIFLRLALAAGLTTTSAMLGVAVGVPPAAAATTNDPFYPAQWGLAQIGAPLAGAGGAGVKIGIVDTGVDLAHPDLQGKVDATATCSNGACSSGGGQDDNGHGTHVSGIAAAITNNGVGVAGVAPGAHLVVAKALDASGSGRVEDITAGIAWVVAHGARVVNLSLGEEPQLLNGLLGGLLGGGGGASPLSAAIESAWSQGAVPVIAAGNDPNTSASYGDLDAMVVGGTNRGGGVAAYSSPLGNAKWGLVAPGGSGGTDSASCVQSGSCQNIVSTYTGGRYATLEGTSMATPHVSGAVALLLSQGFGPRSAIQRLLDTADPVPGCSGACHGRLNVARALGGSPASVAPVPGTAAAPTTARPRLRAASPATTPTTRAPATTEAPTTTVAPTTSMTPSTELPPSTDPPSGSAPAHALGATRAGDRRDPAVGWGAAALLSTVGLALGRVAWLGRAGSAGTTGDVGL